MTTKTAEAPAKKSLGKREAEVLEKITANGVIRRTLPDNDRRIADKLHVKGFVKKDKVDAQVVLRRAA